MNDELAELLGYIVSRLAVMVAAWLGAIMIVLWLMGHFDPKPVPTRINQYVEEHDISTYRI